MAAGVTLCGSVAGAAVTADQVDIRNRSSDGPKAGQAKRALRSNPVWSQRSTAEPKPTLTDVLRVRKQERQIPSCTAHASKQEIALS